MAFDEAVALSTSRLVTGSCIARSYAQHPLLVGQTATVIDLLAPGRLVVGLGPGGVRNPRRGGVGGQERDDAVSLQRWGTPSPSERPIASMREYVDVVRLALSGTPLVSYSGDFYRFADVPLSLVPSGAIPVFLGARRRQMLQLAGGVADGVSCGCSETPPQGRPSTGGVPARRPRDDARTQ